MALDLTGGGFSEFVYGSLNSMGIFQSILFQLTLYTFIIFSYSIFVFYSYKLFSKKNLFDFDFSLNIAIQVYFRRFLNHPINPYNPN